MSRVDRHYNALKSLRCTFVEQFSGLGVDRTERGTLSLRKPGLMRWEYTEPAGKLFVLDGHFAWAYTQGAAQVQRVPAKQMDDLRSPLRLLLGRTRLERELTSLQVTSRTGGYEVSGVPQGLEQRVKRIALDVSEDGSIQAIRIEERDGSVTKFEFSDFSENIVLPEQTFHFQVPPGVPVVEGLPPI